MKIIKTCLDAFLVIAGLGFPETVMDFSDAPGDDLNLDEIFGEHSSSQTTVSTSTNEPQDAPGTTTSPAEPVIKTKTGTVYKSIEDAVEGIEHKDALIAQLRNQVKQNTGQDPLSTRRPDSQQPTVIDYTQTPDKYFEDVADAVAKKDTAAYMRAQQKLMWDNLGPIAPTIIALSRANAERVVTEQIPDFKGFLGSEQFSKAAEEMPLLADAIKAAESNPAAAGQLPELYKVAYLASQGRRVPELIQSVRTPQQTTPRPTVTSTQLAPPASNGVAAVAPSLQTKEGRKALIEQMERTGVGNLKW